MRLFGRELTQYRRQFKELYKYPWFFVKCCILFKQPWKVIRCYMKQESPKDRIIECRSGLKILLSDHPHDVITVFVIFVREDYGKVEPGSVVLDIGANIGVFSLYAAQCGAAEVYAVEPNSACCVRLQDNISANHLSEKVYHVQRAVSSADGEWVQFPRAPSMYNTIAADEEAQDTETVETVSLRSLVNEATVHSSMVHFLKLDCEGGEYPALFSAAEETLAKICHIRMEYHQGRVDELRQFLKRHGFQPIRHKIDGPELGSLWVCRK